MARGYDEYGWPWWTPPLTDEEKAEMEAFALSGVWPFAPIPADADHTNVTPFRKPKAD